MTVVDKVTLPECHEKLKRFTPLNKLDWWFGPLKSPSNLKTADIKAHYKENKKLYQDVDPKVSSGKKNSENCI